MIQTTIRACIPVTRRSFELTFLINQMGNSGIFQWFWTSRWSVLGTGEKITERQKHRGHESLWTRGGVCPCRSACACNDFRTITIVWMFLYLARKARTATTEPDPSAAVESSIQNSPVPMANRAKRKQRLSTVGGASSVSAPPFSEDPASRPKRGKGNQSAVHSSQTPRRSLTAEASDKKGTEYEVGQSSLFQLQRFKIYAFTEAITCARVARKPGRGERLGWVSSCRFSVFMVLTKSLQ